MDKRNDVFRKLEDRIHFMYNGPHVVPTTPHNRKVFMQESYQKWAANDFLSHVKRGVDIYTAAEEYVRTMNEFSCDNRHKNRWMFSIAYDVACDLLDLMYTF